MNEKLFDVDDIIMHKTTKQMFIVSEESQSFQNVFSKEYNLIGNMNEDLNKSYIYSTFICQTDVKQQLLQSVEEMTELNKEILKLVRMGMPGSAKILSNITEELGDVYNALGSLVEILNIDTEQLDKDRHRKIIKYYNKVVKPYSTDYALEARH